jgi:hypothetical protein
LDISPLCFSFSTFLSYFLLALSVMACFPSSSTFTFFSFYISFLFYAPSAFFHTIFLLFSGSFSVTSSNSCNCIIWYWRSEETSFLFMVRDAVWPGIYVYVFWIKLVYLP